MGRGARGDWGEEVGRRNLGRGQEEAETGTRIEGGGDLVEGRREQGVGQQGEGRGQ